MQVKKKVACKNGAEVQTRLADDSGKYAEIVLPQDGITLEQVEKLLIEQALIRFGGNQTKAAQCLGLSRDTIRYRMKKFGIGKD